MTEYIEGVVIGAFVTIVFLLVIAYITIKGLKK